MSRMPTVFSPGSIALRTALVVVVLAAARRADAERVVYARDLALSPDGKTLAFAWAGDLWSVSSQGGDARRLTAHPADESRPVFSHDGRWIALASNRSGSSCVYVMSHDGAELSRLTFGDVGETPTGFSADGAYVYFHARKNGEVDWEPRVYRVPSTGGQPVRVMRGGGSYAVESPDGKTLAFTRGAERWWRTGYRGSANWDVWLLKLDTHEFTQLTDFDGTDFMPAWDARGQGLYFLSDRAGVHNVWHQPLRGAARQVTEAADDRVRDFAVSLDGRTLVYTQWDRVFAQSLPTGRAQEIQIEAPADSPSDPQSLTRLGNRADELAVSPDAKEFAVVAQGELFVGQTEPDQLTRRVTSSVARDRDIAWSPDGKALFFMSDAAGQEDIYRAVSAEQPAKSLSASMRFRVERVTNHPDMEQRPAVSPDGKSLAFVRGLGDLIVRTLESGEERTLLTGWNWPQFRWSPDSKWIAYDVEDAEYNSDIWIVPADGSAAAVNISRHPDNEYNPQWSADGQVLAFSSQRDGFDTDLYFVFLARTLHEKSAVELGNYFKQAGEAAGKAKPLESCIASGKIALAGEAASQPAASKPSDEPKKPDDDKDLSLEDRLRSLIKELMKEPEKEKEKKEKEAAEKHEYELETAWRRIRRVTSLPSDQGGYALSPDGAMLAFVSRHEGEAALFSIKWDGSDLKRVSGGAAQGLHWDLPGKRLYFLSGGTPTSLTGSGGDRKSHAFDADVLVNRAELANQKFNDAARALGMRFYHPTLKGLDWSALSQRHRELALRTRTWAEFNEIFNQLQGMLNGSHLGINGPSRGGPSESIGYLGCEFDPQFAGPGLRVVAVTPNSPAERSESRLYAGDVILKVNGQPVGPDASIERALLETVNKAVLLTVLPSPDRPAASQPATASAPTDDAPSGSDDGTASAKSPTDETEIVIRPIGYGEFRRLQYEAWVAANRAYVEEKSGGRVAYAHIAGMGEAEFYTFERDLYAAAHGKDGLIIDVRNNGGGWTADWVMAVLNVRRHAYTIGRGGQPGYPQDRLIFYSWPKPATMMCNQFSYSNAEIVSHAFKNLKRGPLVGMTTWGAVISTGSYGLIDGTTIRMPFRGWYTLPGGVDMENNGAEPDVKVPLGPADEEAQRDPQLDAAIRATLDQIAAQPASQP